MGRRWSPAPAGKFSPHAGAATHGNGISKLATHPPQHADAPSLQLAAVVLSPFPSHRRGHESAAAFSRSAPRRGAPRQAVRRPAAPAGKFSPHAGALTHGNGISALATHPPLHADVPFPQLAAAVLSPSRSHRAGMGGQRHSVDQPHVEARPAGLRSARLRPAELRRRAVSPRDLWLDELEQYQEVPLSNCLPESRSSHAQGSHGLGRPSGSVAPLSKPNAADGVVGVNRTSQF